MLVYVAILAIMFFLLLWLRQLIGPPYRSEPWRKRWARLLEDEEGEDDSGSDGGNP